MRGRADIRKFSFPVLTVLAVLAVLSLGLAACGGGERQDGALEEGDYAVKIVNASFDPVQQLGDTTLMGLDIENSGAETIPNLAVTVKVLGEEGENARDAFAYRDPQRNLNRHDRPIWILDLDYPTLKGDPTMGTASARTASARTFAFGELAPGETAEAIWQLTPVKSGNYRLKYEISPNIFGVGTIEAEGGGSPSGRLAVRIRPQPEQLRVNDLGRVVRVTPGTP